MIELEGRYTNLLASIFVCLKYFIVKQNPKCILNLIILHFTATATIVLDDHSSLLSFYLAFYLVPLQSFSM